MAKAKAKQKDVLDTFAEQATTDPKRAIQLLLWKQRFENPDMAAVITEKDIDGFNASCAYLDVVPDVQIVRPQGRPAQPAIPAQGKRRAVAATTGEPPRPFVVVSLVKKGTQDQVKPIENNEEDAQRRDQAGAFRRAKEKAPQIAAQLMADTRSGVYSTATISEAAAMLQALARA